MFKINKTYGYTSEIMFTVYGDYFYKQMQTKSALLFWCGEPRLMREIQDTVQFSEGR